MTDTRFVYLQEINREVIEVTEASPGPVGPIGTQPLFQRAGSLAVQTGTSRYYFEYNAAINIIRASVGTSPSGAPVIVDVNKNGTSVFDSPENRLIIEPGQFTTVISPSVTSLVPGDYITVDIDSVGTISPGSDLTVSVTLA